MTINETTTRRIAELNDLCRSMKDDSLWFITPGIAAIPRHLRNAVYAKVKHFDAFNADNDPHSERDFGAITHKGKTIFWKIDYYADSSLTTGSDDPSDPSKTWRVLTLMLSNEY